MENKDLYFGVGKCPEDLCGSTRDLFKATLHASYEVGKKARVFGECPKFRLMDELRCMMHYKISIEILFPS